MAALVFLAFAGTALLVLLLRAHRRGTATATASAQGRLVLAELEPNDSPAQAQAISRLPVELTGRLDHGDHDVYHIAIAGFGDQLLDAWVDGPAGAHLALSREDGTPVGSVLAPGRIADLGVGHGDLLLALDGGAGGVTGPYRLHVELAPWRRGLEWEPDDDGEHASPMTSLAPAPGELSRLQASGRLSAPADIDCFLIPLHVPQKGAVLAMTLEAPAAIRAELTVLDAGQPEYKVPRRKLVELAAPARGAPVVLPDLGARSWEGSYVACVKAADGVDESDPYTLDVRSFTPDGPFEFEANDDQRTASGLPLGVTVRGYLPEGDVDFFRLSAGAPGGAIEVRLAAPPGVAVELALEADDGSTLATGTSAAGASVTLAAEGALFARARPAGGGSIDQLYSIVARSVAGANPATAPVKGAPGPIARVRP